MVGRSFGVDKTQGARFNISKLEPMLAEIHERLAGVSLEQLDFEAFLRRYDGAGSLFYLDPPYWGCETDYGADVFSRDDFARLAETLEQLKGRFLMSINDTPEIRDLFGRWQLTEVETTYSVCVGNNKRVGELLISNFDLG